MNDNGLVKVKCKYSFLDGEYVCNRPTDYNCVGVRCGVCLVDWTTYLIKKNHLIKVKDNE